MNALRLFPVAALCAGLTGCSVMHFTNGPVKPEGRVWEQWHHDMAYSLVEVSKPLDMAALCKEQGGSWSRVTTKDNAVTAIVGGLDQMITSVILFGIDVWDPQMVEYTCGEKPRRVAPPPPAAAPAVPAAPAKAAPAAPAKAPAAAAPKGKVK